MMDCVKFKDNNDRGDNKDNMGEKVGTHVKLEVVMRLVLGKLLRKSGIFSLVKPPMN